MEDDNEERFTRNKIYKNEESINSKNSKQNKYSKVHSFFDEDTINEEKFDNINYYNNYNMKNRINNNDEEEEELDEEENDLSSEDDYENKFKNIKIGILKLKLNILNKIIIAKIQKYYFYFISKINLKIKCNEIFIKGDNFLYSKIKLKTSDANKFYALKKLIYAIRKNAFDKLIKQNYFYQWKSIYEDKYLFNSFNDVEKSAKINIYKFCSILMKIFNKNDEYNYYLKFFMKKWKTLMNQKEIYENKIKKGMLLLSNLFNRKIRKIFKKFPRNFLHLKQKSNLFKAFNNNKQITYIVEDKEKYYLRGLQDFYSYKKKYINLLRQNKLLKIIEKLDIKNKVNKNAFIFFHLLKNSSKMTKYKKQIKNLNNSMIDLKYDSMLNAAIIIKFILNEHICNNLFTSKKIFFEKLYNRYQFNFIRNKYNSIDDIKDEKEKKEINKIRIKNQRILALQKILIINNKHKLYYGNLNIQLKESLLLKYFKLWKKYVFVVSINESLKKLSCQKIFLLLNNVLCNIKRNFLYKLKKNSIHNNFKKKKYYYFAFFIYILLKQHISVFITKGVFYFIKQIWNKKQNSIYQKNNEYLKCKTLYLIYKKYLDIIKYKYLTKWYFIYSNSIRKKEIIQEKIKSILINIDNLSKNHILSTIFNNWHKKTKEIETEEKKKELKIYFYLNKFITMKHLKTLWLYLKKWSTKRTNLKNDLNLNYENLLIQLEQIKKENDDLVAIYYKKRQEYAKTLYDYNYMKKYYCDNCINEKEDEIDYMSLKSSEIKEAGKPFDTFMPSQNKNDTQSKDNSRYLKKTLGDNSIKPKSGMPISLDENNFSVNEENKLQSENSLMNISDEDELSNYVGRKITQNALETNNSKNKVDESNINNITEKNYTHDDNNDYNDINNNIDDYKNEYEEQKKYYENYINILLEKKNELLEMKNLLMSQKLNASKSGENYE